jgi:hypothetical protein
MTDDIDNGIDQLVDDQIAGGERSAPGRFSGSAEYPRCSHCDREWHGLPIIERNAKMHKRREFDEGYRAETDDSRVLCRGSDYIGPMPSERAPGDDREQRSLARFLNGSTSSSMTGLPQASRTQTSQTQQSRWPRKNEPVARS